MQDQRDFQVTIYMVFYFHIWSNDTPDSLPNILLLLQSIYTSQMLFFIRENYICFLHSCLYLVKADKKQIH